MTLSISSFPVSPLSKHATIQPGFAFKSDRFTTNSKDVPLVKGENVQQGYINWEASRYWPAVDFEAHRAYQLEVGDVVLAMDRPWVSAGLKWAYIKPTDPPSLLVQRVSRLRSKNGLDQTYLRCLISSKYFSAYIQPIVTGVNVPHISGRQIGGFKIPLPRIAAQRKIAAVISAYDDLIENNRHRISLLERMAEQLYREWFVRFRFPGYEHAKFEKGIPVGWDSAPALKFFGYVRGKSYASDDLSADPKQAPFITLKSFNRGGGYRADGLKRFSGRHKPEQLVQLNDIVMAVTDMTQGREVIGRVARVPDFGGQGAVISMDVIKLVPKTISSSFLYSYMRLSGFGEFIKEFANGTNVLHLKPDLVTQQRITMPPKELREHFSKIVEPIFEQIDVLSHATAPLEASRDLLLPRLISGKLRIDDLDIQFPPSMQDAAA